VPGRGSANTLGELIAGKYVLKRTAGGYRWNLHASNGKVIATSEQYETKRAALAGIESTRKNAGDAKLVDETEPGAAAAG
jgi:uncharacterized protein